MVWTVTYQLFDSRHSRLPDGVDGDLPFQTNGPLAAAGCHCPGPAAPRQAAIGPLHDELRPALQPLHHLKTLLAAQFPFPAGFKDFQQALQALTAFLGELPFLLKIAPGGALKISPFR